MAEANKKQNFLVRGAKRIARWFREMKSELKKVVWPSPQKVTKNTITVIACTVAIGACIWIFDGVAGLFVKTLLNIFA